MSIMDDLEKFAQDQKTKRQIETKNLLDKINYRQSLINEKDKIIENLNYEKELITSDIIELVQSLSSSEIALCWGVNNRLYHDAWYFFHRKDEIDDEEKKNKFENSYDLVITQIKTKILLRNKNFKLQNISVCGYDEQGYSFYYKYKKHTFELYVPMFDRATNENYKDMMLGYRVLIQTGEHSWSAIICDLNPDVVANKLKEYIENLETEEKKEK